MLIHILLINLNHKDDTAACIRSILRSTFRDFFIHLLDNGSAPSELNALKTLFKDEHRIEYYRSEKNLGFAAGNNLMLDALLPKCGDDETVLFLNNDSEIEPNLLELMAAAVDQSRKIEMVAARMMRFDDRSRIDNLGIGMYVSGISLSRRHLEDIRLFGPSGGCALYTVSCLKAIHEKTGHVFDPDFFCYVEDTDLAWRGLLCGFKPVYCDDAVCYHMVGRTTGGNFNRFVMFHTLRNTLLALVKNLPIGLWICYGLWIILFQIAMMIRFIVPLRFTPLFRGYWSFFKLFPTALRHRRRIMKNRAITNAELLNHFTRRVYHRGSFRSLLRGKLPG